MKAPANAEVYETPLLNCWFGENGILYSVSKKADRTIENYDILFEVYNTLSKSGTKKLCTVGDITKTQPLSKSVRHYITGELPKYIKAMALISDSAMGRIIGNFFIKLNPQQYPTRIFNSLRDAEQWLKQYVENENAITVGQ